MESASTAPAFQYQVSFRALTSAWRSMAFPCDATGLINFDFLSPSEKNDYLFARAMMGRDYAAPAVQLVG